MALRDHSPSDSTPVGGVVPTASVHRGHFRCPRRDAWEARPEESRDLRGRRGLKALPDRLLRALRASRVRKEPPERKALGDQQVLVGLTDRLAHKVPVRPRDLLGPLELRASMG